MSEHELPSGITLAMLRDYAEYKAERPADLLVLEAGDVLALLDLLEKARAVV